jgi:hypothetical protein
MKDVQATQQASASKENIQHFKTCNFFTFSIFVVQFFCPPGSEDDQNLGANQIHNTI